MSKSSLLVFLFFFVFRKLTRQCLIPFYFLMKEWYVRQRHTILVLLYNCYCLLHLGSYIIALMFQQIIFKPCSVHDC